MHRLAPAEPRLRRCGPEAAASVGIHRDGAAPDRQPHVGEVGYYGRRFWDLYTTVNDAVPPSAYTPVTITNPLTNEPLIVYNQDPATRGQVRNVLKTIPDLSSTTTASSSRSTRG